MLQTRALGIGALVIGGCVGAALLHGRPPAVGAKRAAPKVRYVRLLNSTPSPAWSPDGRFLAFHALTPTTPSWSFIRGGAYRWPKRLPKAGATKLTGYTGPRSHLAVLQVSTFRIKRFFPQRLKSGTASPSAWFHPRWGGSGLLMTSSSFSGVNLLLRLSDGARMRYPRMGVATFGQGARLLVGRRHQTGVFVARTDRPTRQYAVVDERGRIRGLFPAFSPNGRFLAWIDAAKRGTAAQLKVLRVGFTAANLDRKAKLWVADPWRYRKKRHRAVKVRTLPTAKTPKVVEFAWGPRSRSIAFVTGRFYGGYGNYRYRSRGLYHMKIGRGRPAPRRVGLGENPAFDRAGRLYYSRKAGGIVRWDPRTGRRKVILGRGHAPRPSPNGRLLAFEEWRPNRPGHGSKLFLGLTRLPAR